MDKISRRYPWLNRALLRLQFANKGLIYKATNFWFTTLGRNPARPSCAGADMRETQRLKLSFHRDQAGGIVAYAGRLCRP